MDGVSLYQVVSHLDESKRYMSLTIDELYIVVIGLMLLTTSNHKFLVGILSAVIYSFLKYLKKGNGPRFLLIQVYWHMPDMIAKLIVPKLPKSYYRLWRG